MIKHDRPRVVPGVRLKCSTELKFSLRDFCTLLRSCGRCARSGAATQPGATATPGRPPANGSTLQTNRILCGYSLMRIQRDPEFGSGAITLTFTTGTLDDLGAVKSAFWRSGSTAAGVWKCG